MTDILEEGAEEVLDELDETSTQFIDALVKKLILFTEEFCDVELFPYQIPPVYRLIESIVIGDGEELTLIAARQTGKTELISNVIASMMVILPKLASVYPTWLGKFSKGFWVGIFAPVEEQADTMFGRVVNKLTSEHAMNFLLDPELDDRATSGGSRGKGKAIALKKSGSLCRMQTCNPKAKIESKTYHLVLVDEAQGAEETMITKSLKPMLAFNNGTIILSGTATREKCYFLRMIQYNRRRDANLRRGHRQSHFEYDYRTACKYNQNYAKFIAKEKLRLGEDSDEFRMSYCLAPGTKVLTADLRHVPVESLVPGMKVVGFDEQRPGKGLHRNYREAEVLAVGSITRPGYRLTLSDGTSITCSAEHQWLVSTAGGRTEWKTTESLTGTDRLFRMTDVWAEDNSRLGGYLAAAFDGEGCLNVANGNMTQLTFTQRDNAMLEEVKRGLTWHKFNFGEYEGGGTNRDCRILHIQGKADILRFLGQFRPHRLLSKFDLSTVGSIGRHDGRHNATVVTKEFLGDIEVIPVKTSTGTLVAEGFATHNCNEWILEKGMFITDERLDSLYDTSMPLVKSWWRTPIVIGIDVARSNDSTVATAVWVDWDHPDGFGFYEHRVLNWLEINDVEWEKQYFEIIDFVRQYDVFRIGVDSQGVGGAVAERLQILLPNIEVIPVTSDAKNQHTRWVHLTELVQREQLRIPGHSKARRTRMWKKFHQQMSDLEKVYRGPYLLAAAPDERGAFDDYPDSLAIACSLTQIDTLPQVTVSESPFYGR